MQLWSNNIYYIISSETYDNNCRPGRTTWQYSSRCLDGWRVAPPDAVHVASVFHGPKHTVQGTQQARATAWPVWSFYTLIILVLRLRIIKTNGKINTTKKFSVVAGSFFVLRHARFLLGLRPRLGTIPSLDARGETPWLTYSYRVAFFLPYDIAWYR